MNKYILTVLGLALFFSISSCKKDTSAEVQGETGVSFKLENVIGLADEGDINLSVAANKINISNKLVAKVISNKTIKDKEANFEIIKEEINTDANTLKDESLASVKPEYPKDYVPANGNNLSHLMLKGTTFRIMVYDVNGNFVEQVEGTAGSATLPMATNLKKGTTYNWFAYSYYSKEPLASIPDANKNKPELDVENEDFLFTKGTFTTGTGTGIPNTDVVIQFHHAMAMVDVAVLTGGFSALTDMTKFLSSDVSRPYIRLAANTIQKGKFDLKTGEFIASSIQNIAQVTDAVAKANYSYVYQYPGTSYRGFFYTVPGATNDYINNFTVEIQTWMILDRPTNPKIYTKTYTDKVRKGKGKFSRITVIPFDNGISIPGGSSVAPTRWSRGDLYYDESQPFKDQDGFTRFQHRNHEATSIFYGSTFLPYGVAAPTLSYGQTPANYGHTYYQALEVYPLGNGTGAAPQGDPCENLKPNGSVLNYKWKTPTIAEGKALADYINANANSGRISHTYNSTSRSIIFVVNNNGASSVDDWTERVSFEMKGFAAFNASATPTYQMDAKSIPYKTPAVAPNNQEGYGYFWLDTEDPNSFAYLQLHVNSAGIPSSLPTPNSKFEAKVFRTGLSTIVNGIYPATNDKKTAAMNVRCVRTDI